MKEVEDNSVNLVVTSPPYYGAKMWNCLWKELGFRKEAEQEPSLEEFNQVNIFLNQIYDECMRVITPGGYAVINTWDIASGNKGYGRWPNTNETINHFIQNGFKYKDFIVWEKNQSRLFSGGSFPYPGGVLITTTTENILIFKKDGEKEDKPTTENKEKSKLNKQELSWISNNIWRINTESAKKLKHVAPYPVEIPYRIIKLYSFYGDIVLDPFMGSGTTAIACISTGRKYIGYEFKKEYYNNCIERIRSNSFSEELIFEEKSSKKFDDGYKRTKLNLNLTGE